MLAMLAGFAACQPQNVREEKALRRQLAREIRSHAYETAVPIARQLLQQHPQDDKLWSRLVHAQIALHNFDGARESLARWRSSVPQPPPKVDLFEGNIAEEEHDYDRALDAWRAAAMARPHHRAAFEKIAALEQNRRHWNEAAEAWTNALQAKETARSHINRAVCYRRLRRWDDAFKDLHEAQKIGRDDPDLRRWQNLFDSLGKYLDEIRDLDARLAGLPGDVGLLGDRALLFLRTGDPELALDDAEMAGRLAPWAVRPKLFKAIALIALQRAKECERLSVRQPIRLDTLPATFLEAAGRLDTAISVEPKNADHYITRAWQLNEIGQPLLALQDAETAATLDPRSAEALAEVSYALHKLGRSEDAFEKIRSATELDPNSASAWQYRGELEVERGNNPGAIDSLTHSLNIEQTAAALQKREECYRRAGMNARADEDHRALQTLSARAGK
jgi:tetratricopeptide (TPR) repeat protein